MDDRATQARVEAVVTRPVLSPRGRPLRQPDDSFQVEAVGAALELGKRRIAERVLPGVVELGVVELGVLDPGRVESESVESRRIAGPDGGEWR